MDHPLTALTVLRWRVRAAFADPTERAYLDALCRLQRPPVITSYDFEDGREVNRRAVNPIAELAASFASIAEGMSKVGEAVEQMFSSLRQIGRRAPNRGQ